MISRRRRRWLLGRWGGGMGGVKVRGGRGCTIRRLKGGGKWRDLDCSMHST